MYSTERFPKAYITALAVNGSDKIEKTTDSLEKRLDRVMPSPTASLLQHLNRKIRQRAKDILRYRVSAINHNSSDDFDRAVALVESFCGGSWGLIFRLLQKVDEHLAKNPTGRPGCPFFDKPDETLEEIVRSYVNAAEQHAEGLFRTFATDRDRSVYARREAENILNDFNWLDA